MADRPKAPTETEMRLGRERLEALLPDARTAAETALDGRDLVWTAGVCETFQNHAGIDWGHLDALVIRKDLLRRRHVSLRFKDLPDGLPTFVEIRRPQKTDGEAFQLARELLVGACARIRMREMGIEPIDRATATLAFQVGDLEVALPLALIEDAAVLAIPGSDSEAGRARVVGNLQQSLHKILKGESAAVTWASLDETKQHRARVVMATLVHLGVRRVDAAQPLPAVA